MQGQQGAGEGGRQDTAGYPHPHPAWSIHPDSQHFSALSTPVKQMEGKNEDGLNIEQL